MGTPQVDTRPPMQAAPQVVELTTAVEHNDGIEFEVDGLVVPYREVDIAAQVSGRIVFKADNCRIGRAVKTGDLLLQIEKQDYEIEVKRLEEAVAQAEAMLGELDAEIDTIANQIDTAEAQAEIASRQLKRSLELEERRITSDVEAEEARVAELSSRNALQTLKDQRNLLIRRRTRLESAKKLEVANLEQAELALSRTEIRSPLDGVVVTENVEQDGYIQAGNVLLRLQDSSRLDVTCKLRMHEMNWLWQSAEGQANPDEVEPNALENSTDTASSLAYHFPKTPATVVFKLGPTSYEWQGVVDRYDGAGIDNQTRMIPCRVHVDDPLQVSVKEGGAATYAKSNPPTLMTGMFVEVWIRAQPPIPLVRVPQQAVQPGNQVWTVENGKLKPKKVTVATSDATDVIVYQEVGGLQAGDRIVVSPIATPIEGLAVVDAASAPPPSAGPVRGSGGDRRGGGPAGGGGRNKPVSTDRGAGAASNSARSGGDS